MDPEATLDPIDETVIESFNQWAQSHPRPDEPLFRTLDGAELSPRRLAVEVAERSRLGIEQVAALKEVSELAHIQLSDLLAGMVRSVQAPAAQAFS